MGKYMRKGRGVGKMEVSQGSLGVRTRARALAIMQQQQQQIDSSISMSHLNSKAESDPSLTQAILSDAGECTAQLYQDDTYMELRSRRLEKVVRSREELAIPPVLKCDVARGRIELSGGEEGPTLLTEKEKEGCGNLFQQNCTRAFSDEESSRHGLRESNRRQQRELASTNVELSKPGHVQVCLHSAVKGAGSVAGAVGPAGSSHSISNSSILQNQGRTLGMLTRNQRQELANLAKQEAFQEEGPLYRDRDMEIEPEFGESPLVTSHNRASGLLQGTGAKLSTREGTPESFINDGEAPGSTTRNRPHRFSTASLVDRLNGAPSSREIEAFFDNAERQERRRFMDKYNFDPLTETPFQGRYDWTRLE